jgi:hypothetical protein
MEVLVRIAIQKYYKSKQVPTVMDAIKMAFDVSIIPFISKYDSHEWRKKRLWNEECDLVIKYYYSALKQLYEKFSGKFAKPGMPKYEINHY